MTSWSDSEGENGCFQFGHESNNWHQSRPICGGLTAQKCSLARNYPVNLPPRYPTKVLKVVRRFHAASILQSPPTPPPPPGRELHKICSESQPLHIIYEASKAAAVRAGGAPDASIDIPAPGIEVHITHITPTTAFLAEWISWISAGLYARLF